MWRWTLCRATWSPTFSPETSHHQPTCSSPSRPFLIVFCPPFSSLPSTRPSCHLRASHPFPPLSSRPPNSPTKKPASASARTWGLLHTRTLKAPSSAPLLYFCSFFRGLSFRRIHSPEPILLKTANTLSQATPPPSSPPPSNSRASYHPFPPFPSGIVNLQS